MAKTSLPGETWKRRKRRKKQWLISVRAANNGTTIVYRAPVGTGAPVYEADFLGWERIGHLTEATVPLHWRKV